jgi:hypothetical protein
MLLDEIARTSAEVAAASARSEKTRLLAASLGSVSEEELPIAVAYLSGELPQGSVGVGWASLVDVPPPAESPTLELADVDGAVSRIAAAAGKGSQAIRRTELVGLFERATEREQRFLSALFLGELRQGALEGVMVDAVAKAAGLESAAVRRAAMLAGDLGGIAGAAMGAGGESRSSRSRPRPRSLRSSKCSQHRGCVPRARATLFAHHLELCQLARYYAMHGTCPDTQRGLSAAAGHGRVLRSRPAS